MKSCNGDDEPTTFQIIPSGKKIEPQEVKTNNEEKGEGEIKKEPTKEIKIIDDGNTEGSGNEQERRYTKNPNEQSEIQSKESETLVIHEQKNYVFNQTQMKSDFESKGRIE